MKQFGLKGKFGTPETLTINGSPVSIVIENFANSSSSKQVLGLDHEGETVNVTTFDRTSSITVSGWIKADFDEALLPSGEGFTITNENNEMFCICESFEVTKVNNDIARFSLSATHFPKISAPVPET